VWQLYWDLGTTRFLFLEDPDGAADVLLTGAELPDAPAWLKALGGRVLSNYDRRGTARLLWQQVYDEHTGAMRDNALMNLQYLDALDLVDEYQRRLTAFRERTGSWPASLAAVAGSGAARLPEIDPAGTAFDYNPESGRVRLSRSSLLWALAPNNQR
jgi:hypothetical protein